MKTLAEHILVLKNAMPKEVCEDLISTYNRIHANDPHKVNWNNKIYKFEEVNLLDSPDFKDFIPVIGQLMKSVTAFYSDKVHNILKDRLVCYEPLKDYEAPRMKRYEPGEGIFDWHIDAFDRESSRRAVVMFWYLNDVEEGGETIFDVGKVVKVKPEAGTVCVFPPMWMFPHKGATPISNPKYCISSYAWLPDGSPQCDPLNEELGNGPNKTEKDDSNRTSEMI